MNNVLGQWEGNTLHLPGELCLADCEGLNPKQIAFPAGEVTIDAVKLVNIDSIGIAALVLLMRRARKQKIELQWVNVGEHLRKMFAVYELDYGVFLSCRNS